MGTKRTFSSQEDRSDSIDQKRCKQLEDWYDSIEKASEKLKRFVAGCPNSKIDSEEHINCFTGVYNVCNFLCTPYHDKVYAKYKQICEGYVTSIVMPAIQDKKDDDQYLMLRELLKQWQNFKYFGQRLSRFFNPLNRYIVSSGLPTVEEVITITFRNLVYKEINCKARDAVISFTDKEREGEQIDSALLKKVSDFFVEMGMDNEESLYYYNKDFEQHLIVATGLYYSRKASSWIVEDSCPSYLIKAEECFRKESEMVSRCMHSISEEKLIERVQHNLLVVNQKQLLDNEKSGCRALLRDEKHEDLSRMFRLFRKLPGSGLEPMVNIFKQCITDQGKALVQQIEDAAASSGDVQSSAKEKDICIGKIIELHDKCMAYVSSCFSDYIFFRRALRHAFEAFCNKVIGGSPSVEVLATFCDNLINKGDSDEVVEETLEKVAELLDYFDDKDLFIEFHRKKLGRRLLFDKSGTKDYDTTFLAKLKQQYGACFTSKIEGMLTDVTLAKENQRELEVWFDSNPSEKPNYDLSVTVLTTGFWPSHMSSNLNLPSEMAKGVEAYKKMYEAKEKYRKLTWIYSLGSCHINVRFEQKTIELIVSTYQASALLLFDDADILTFSEIHTQLNMSHDDVVRVLHSLSCTKYKILNKEPKTKTISETDTFEFNTKFTDRMRRIRIPLPPIDERKKIIEDVIQDRQYQIDVALVRIMKSRKAVGHQQLVSECVELLSKNFKPDIKTIQKRIESLIDQGFIERDSNNQNVFNYLV